MKVNPATRRLEQLRAEIRRHEHLYYVLDQPELTDAQYDALFLELRQLEEQHPDLVEPDSPTQRVGGTASEQFAKVRHRSPMLSLQNAFDVEEVLAFDRRVRALAGRSLVYVCELKIDGLAMSLTYDHGKLVRAATRGDGQVGEDVTANVRTLRSVPLAIEPLAGLPVTFEVRGEVYFPLAAFEKLNRDMEAAGRQPFMNPRNAAAGSVRQIDPGVTAGRNLQTFMYALDPAGRSRSQWEVLEGLAAMDLRVNPNRARFENIEGVIEYHHHWQQHRHELDHEIDGVVVKIDRHDQQQELGFVARSPRWAVAYKYAAEQQETQVEEIVCYVGRTGVLTPVAHLRPVIVGGVTVRNATLHNEALVNQKGVYPGATVVVQRAGDVIPEVVSVPEPKPGWKMPAKCPVCGGDVVREEPYIAHRCINPFCPAQRLERLRHFAGRGAMDIDGLGLSTLQQLIQRELVQDPSDLYRLQVEQLIDLDRFAVKSAQKLFQRLQESRDRPLDRFLYALGIPQVGSATAELLAREFNTLERLAEADEAELINVEGVGASMAAEIHRFFAGTGGELARRLLDAGVRPQPVAAAPQGALSGKIFVFTGTLERMSRPEAEELVRQLGGKATGGVSARTHYVVAGEAAGSKLEKAQRLKLRVLDEEAFFALLGR
ncbi:MAG: NAD-dependent DNA ligase LigA [Candidatus Dormibacteraeota bacterium]|uniref:DNA ligase n=1 Tax=Candidatus Dormiibacter inghamiae TaxID=3127013 RepID=A0A934NCK4_9BACT|nr:NAD-dependent DNA ligase LigA [Candidatus Dormibacteraeota bacterium]MBJ7605407.1 NAD-dependent DNA ligase LigA [Candidatus Dormibacteraeota bacterium]